MNDACIGSHDRILTQLPSHCREEGADPCLEEDAFGRVHRLSSGCARD